jgi:hypothetical protein
MERKMATSVLTTEAITEVSAAFRETGTVEVGELRDLVVPIPAELTCEAYFDSPLPTKGTRLIVGVNGEDVIELSYDGAPGQRQGRVEISDHLAPGANELRVRCLVSCTPLDRVADAGEVWLRSSESTIIRKRFSTKGSLEPFDLRWTLFLEH